MKKTENKGKLPFGTNGVKRTMIALAALIMLTTIFIPILGAAETENSATLTVYGTVEDEFGVPSNWFMVGYENMNKHVGNVSEFTDGKYYLEIENVSIGDTVSLNFTNGKCFTHKEIIVDSLQMEKQLNITLDPMREKPKSSHFEKPDIEGIKDAMAPLEGEVKVTDNGYASHGMAHVKESRIPVYLKAPDFIIGNSSEDESNPPIVMSDMGAYPMEMPDLTDTHLSWRDLRHWRDLFPKFMAFEDKDNIVHVDLKNVGNESYTVKLDLYEINPDGNKTLLGTEHYGMLLPDMEKRRMQIWVPEMGGRNYVYGEIYVMEVNGGMWHPAVNWTLINTFKKSFNVVPSDRPVRIINGDWTIDTPTVIDSETVVVNGDVEISENFTLLNSTLLAGDFKVTDKKTVVSSSVVDLQANYIGEYKVEVYPSGHLMLYGKILNNPDDIYYNFYMNGSLTVDKDPHAAEVGSISEVNGNANDLSAPSGIIAKDAAGKIRILNGGTVYNCRAHALWLDNSDALIQNGIIRDTEGMAS